MLRRGPVTPWVSFFVGSEGDPIAAPVCGIPEGSFGQRVPSMSVVPTIPYSTHTHHSIICRSLQEGETITYWYWGTNNWPWHPMVMFLAKLWRDQIALVSRSLADQTLWFRVLHQHKQS
jgi:hypothetical protein